MWDGKTARAGRGHPAPMGRAGTTVKMALFGAPERPGLGIDIDWDLIRSSVIAEL